MSELYALTSAPLFGIVSQMLGDRQISSSVLKSVYARVWELGLVQELPREDPLNFLRALAHRMAMDYKLKHDIQNSTPSQFANMKELSGHNLNKKEFALFRLAYLNALPSPPSSEFSNVSEEEMERLVKEVLLKIRRDRNEHS